MNLADDKRFTLIVHGSLNENGEMVIAAPSSVYFPGDSRYMVALRQLQFDFNPINILNGVHFMRISVDGGSNWTVVTCGSDRSVNRVEMLIHYFMEAMPTELAKVVHILYDETLQRVVVTLPENGIMVLTNQLASMFGYDTLALHSAYNIASMPHNLYGKHMQTLVVLAPGLVESTYIAPSQALPVLKCIAIDRQRLRVSTRLAVDFDDTDYRVARSTNINALSFEFKLGDFQTSYRFAPFTDTTCIAILEFRQDILGFL